MKRMSSPQYATDKLVALVMLLGVLGVAFLVFLLNTGWPVEHHSFHLEDMMMFWPFFPGFIAAAGVFFSQRWGFWMAIVLSLLFLLPSVPALMMGQAIVLIPLLPAVCVLIYCFRRIGGSLGPLMN